MSIKKKVVVFIIILILVFATVVYFFVDKNGKDEYKGTLVREYCQEAIL